MPFCSIKDNIYIEYKSQSIELSFISLVKIKINLKYAMIKNHIIRFKD